MERLTRLLNLLLARQPWTQLRTTTGSAADVPARFLELVRGIDEAETERLYWRLDNHVVVQGRAFETSAALLPAIFVAISATATSFFARRWLVELLTEIVLARGHEDEPNPAAIEQAISSSVVRSLWIVYGLLASDDAIIRRAALEIVVRAETDPARRDEAAKAMLDDSDEQVRALAARSV